ncbi:hypothetical protein B9Z55_014462 [Caenorhabditis nigoni]|uniref:SCP domain-containing protein n=1 Tax=Caenorhabditis nigoni TaxID=1611254 RepID=A0A2G5U5Z1_9PELO|nr:hypothetical protein B9Z55_014462 [Caenorhabditis nigoni]
MYSIIPLILLLTGSYAQFTSNGSQAIVDAHNKLRSSIAKGTYVAKGSKKPSASNMRKMIWDNSVATSAQNYANGCPKGHSGASGLGENLYWSWTSGTVSSLDTYGTVACAEWEKEFQDNGWTSNTMNSALFNSGVGHATQMAWANTSLIGCGVKNCGRDSSMNNMFKITVVCQYKPPGNYMNQPIYEQGTTCSSCPSSTKCETETGLCA